MIWLTHMAFAFLVARFFFNELTVVQTLMLFFSALFPDIDNKNSLIGRFFKLGTKHRQLFHSLILILPVGYLIFKFAGKVYFEIFLIGSVSHIVLDSLTKAGVGVLYPFKFRFKGPIKTNSLLDYLLFFIFLFLLIYV